jgi:sulfatase maturation enzyme AslB (radical SAM superfamily)
MLANPNGIIHISLNPSYHCNFRCKHCYLTEEQLSNRQLLQLEKLDKRLTEIKASGHTLGHMDLYGGEVMIMPKGYIQSVKSILHNHGINEIEIITNLSALNKDIVDDEDFGISVSYDFTARERHGEVYENMLKMSRHFTVLTLATPEVIKMDVDELIMELNTLGNMYCWEIKPYSTNQANQSSVTFSEFEEFIKRIFQSPIPKNFEFLNASILYDTIKGERNSFSDDHIYITPTGKFAVLEFDLNDNEYFLELDNFDKYLEWCIIEKNRVFNNKFCSQCEFSGKCLSEHLRKVVSLHNSCNGFHNLIQWAKTNVEVRA